MHAASRFRRTSHNGRRRLKHRNKKMIEARVAPEPNSSAHPDLVVAQSIMSHPGSASTGRGFICISGAGGPLRRATATASILAQPRWMTPLVTVTPRHGVCNTLCHSPPWPSSCTIMKANGWKEFCREALLRNYRSRRRTVSRFGLLIANSIRKSAARVRRAGSR
jgi:hypothetical protein